jgi:putative DNA primase/helicase
MTSNPIDGFRDAIFAACMTAPETIEADGKLHRFSSNGKTGDDAGWYVLHFDGVPAGIFGDWRTGLSETWKADTGRKLTKQEVAQQRAKFDALRSEREAAEKHGHEEAAAKAAASWQTAQPAFADHGYLAKKGIKPHGTKVGTDGRLLVPMRDAAGKLWNIERVAPEKPADGSAGKKGLYLGRRTGCYFSIGNPKAAEVLCIAEGFATGASIHEATGMPVAVTFDAGNLESVAKALRKKLPDLPMVICADDDYCSEGNPGRTKAEAAALAVGGVMVLPVFQADRPEKATDFNDLHQSEGIDAVRRIVMSVVEVLTAQPTEAQPKSEDPSEADSDAPVMPVTPTVATGDGEDQSESDESVPEPSPFPGEDNRPCYVVLDDWTECGGRKHRPGVYFCGMTEAKKDTPAMPFDLWFCSPLYIDAVTFDGQANNFGRLLRFKNSLGRWREWAMPMELLRGAGDELRGELLAMGVELDPYKARQQLPAYLQRDVPKRRMHCALQVGWAGKSFVLPDQVIGPDAADVVFQSGERSHEEHTKSGTLQGWQEGIALKASCNPVLLLALSAGFAGPMLARCNAEGGGIHFVGDSSTGKTTAIEASCSIWGGPNYRRSWRATANGMEGAAALFNDCLLALDELSECDPKEVGAIVYALGNGRGKQRASRSGSARGVVRWRCFVLSSGERTVSTTMAEGGHRAKAGQSVRMLDVPVARKYGAWDDLRGATSAAAFSDGIKRAAAQHHGLVGRAFLEKLTHDTRDFCAMLEEVKTLPMFSAEGGEGQDKRAAGRLALIGLAGELATEYGLTGWQEGEAIQAAAEGFKLWRSMRGTGNDERRQIAERMSGFLERHGDGRFSNADSGDEVSVKDRAGWWRNSSDDREYLLTAEAMREALKGFDFSRALDVLQELGALPKPGADGKRARLLRIGGQRPVRLYPINPEKLTGGEHAA